MFRTMKLKLFALLALALAAATASAQSVTPARVIFDKNTGQIIVADIPGPRPTPAPTPRPTPRPTPNTTSANHPLVAGKFHADKAAARLAQLSEQEQGRYKAILARGANQLEQAYIMKAFAVGHDLDAVESFANEIRGKGAAWLRNNLHLTASTTMTGVMQQWSHSCGPTTAQALFGDIDPLFALDVNKNNPSINKADDRDGTKLNPDLAEEQRVWLEKAMPDGRQGGAATARAAGNQGRGRWCEDVFTEGVQDLGLTYKANFLGGAYNLERAMADLDKALDRGLPVPLVVKAQTSSHYVLAIRVVNVNGQKTYIMHDPWTGQTTARTEEQFKNNTLNLSGNNTLMAVSIPIES
jgi:hypothetical protein